MIALLEIGERLVEPTARRPRPSTPSSASRSSSLASTTRSPASSPSALRPKSTRWPRRQASCRGCGCWSPRTTRQPAGAVASGATTGDGRRCRQQRARGARRARRARLRRRADGLPDAGDGRLHGDARDPLARGGRHDASADRGRHRERDARGLRALPRVRHGRLRRQAGHPRGAVQRDRARRQREPQRVRTGVAGSRARAATDRRRRPGGARLAAGRSRRSGRAAADRAPVPRAARPAGRADRRGRPGRRARDARAQRAPDALERRDARRDAPGRLLAALEAAALDGDAAACDQLAATFAAQVATTRAAFEALVEELDAAVSPDE